MILIRAHIVLVVCILFVAYVEAEKGVKKDVSKSDTGATSGELKPRQGYYMKKARKMFNNHMNMKKTFWKKKVQKYKKPSHKKQGREKIAVGESGETVNIGEKDKPERNTGQGTKAYCIEVLNENEFEEMRNIETKIVDDSGKDLSSQFELKLSRLWKCINAVTAKTFFIVDQEYMGDIEVQDAFIAYNVKAWAVELDPDDSSDTRKTIQFTIEKFLDEHGTPINYLGDTKRETPNRKKWRFWNKRDKRNKQERNDAEGKKEGEKKEKEPRRKHHKDKKDREAK